jgi:hypothetical protein
MLMKSADQLLKDAKQQWDNGDTGAARYHCNQILESYPGSDAAKEAQAILDGLEPASSATAGASARPSSTTEVISTNYATARGVAAFIGFLGWVIVLGGIGAMLFAASQGHGVVGVLLSIGVTIAGFLQIMGSQLVTATLDNADHTREMVTLMKSRRSRHDL